jgi:stage V sporulation protein G
MTITDVKITRLESDGKIRAMASVTFDECFVVTGLRIMEGSNGLFVAMPSRKLPNGTYKDICFPVTRDTREAIQEAVLAKYIEPNHDDGLGGDDDELPF